MPRTLRPESASNSPFTPGYGRSPHVYGGHADLLSDMRRVFSHHDYGENQSVLLSGLRGAGKTSMLMEIVRAADENGWLVLSDDASPSLMDRLVHSRIPALMGRFADSTERRLTGLGLWQFSAEWSVSEHAPSALLRDKLRALGEFAEGSGVLVTIDEVSSDRRRLREVAAVAREIAHSVSSGTDVVVAFAGIRVDLDELIRQEHTTFLRRSRRVTFSRLSPQETRRVLVETAYVGGRCFTDEALALLVAASQGYPYLVQLLGDYSWRLDQASDEIGLAAAESAQLRGTEAVMDRVVSKVYGDLSPKDRDLLEAMASDDDCTRVGDLQERLGRSKQYVNRYRRRLIDSGYVEAAGRGQVRFALPHLREYIRDVTDSFGSAAEIHDEWADYPPPPL